MNVSHASAEPADRRPEARRAQPELPRARTRGQPREGQRAADQRRVLEDGGADLDARRRLVDAGTRDAAHHSDQDRSEDGPTEPRHERQRRRPRSPGRLARGKSLRALGRVWRRARLCHDEGAGNARHLS